MSTSLAEQLQRLAVPQTANLRRTDKKRASILFDPKEAANISKETLFQIGFDGLEELKSKNPVFASYENTLFHLTGKNFERAVQTSEANQKLNQTLKSFFHQLLPYFLMNASHKALEWLVYRYNIHDYNKDDLILLILPYHDTNIFIRVLQIIEIGENDKWLWLKPLQKPGVHLSKNVLYNHAASNPGFIQLMSDHVLAAICEHGKPSYLSVLFNFYCATFTGALEKSNNLNENHVVPMLLSIVKGLKSEIPDFCASAYIILAKMLTKITLTENTLDSLLENLTKMNVTMLHTEALLVMIVLYQTQQDFTHLPLSAVQNLSEKEWLPGLLQELADDGCIISTIVMPMLASAIKIGIEEVRADHGKVLVNRLLNSLKLDADIVHQIFEILTTYYKREMSYPSKTKRWMKSIMDTIERQYPLFFDKEVSLLMQNSIDGQLRQQRETFQHIIQNKDIQNQINLFEKLHHPQRDIRRIAVNSVLQQYDNLKNREQDLLKNVLSTCLSDDNVEMVHEALKPPLKNMLHVFDKAELKKIFLQVIYKHKFSLISWKVISKLVHLGVYDDYAVLIALFPYLMSCNETSLKCVTVLLADFVPKCKTLKRIQKVIMDFKRRDVAAAVRTNLKKIKLDSKQLVDAVQKENVQDATFMCTVAILFGYTSTAFSSDMIRIVLEHIRSAGLKFCKGDTGNINFPLAATELPLSAYLRCINAIILKSPKQPLHACDFREEQEFTQTCLLLFNTLLEGAFSTEKVYLQAFAQSIKVFLRHFAHNNEIEFLLNYAISDNSPAQASNRLRALKSAHALLSNKTHLNAVSNNKSLVAPYLIVCLHSEHKEIRNLALQCLSKTVQAGEMFQPLIMTILERKEEISQDAEQLPFALSCDYARNHPHVANLVALLSENLPLYLKSGIVAACERIDDAQLYEALVTSSLRFVAGESVLSRKIIADCIEQFSVVKAQATSVQTASWQFIVAVLQCDKAFAEEETAPAIMLLQTIDKSMFNAFSPDVQTLLLDLIIRMTTYSSNPEMLPAAAKLFKHIDLDALAILEQLVKMRDVVSPKMQTRLRRRVSVVPTIDILDMSEWRMGTTVLEFIQEKKKMRSVERLVPVLFDILKKCLDFDEQASVEYPKQLLLSSILHYCDKIDATSLPANVFNVELVVQCIRASPNPQTHHHALLLLAKVAAFIPDQVLLHIMAIFTFMGSSVLRHDDAYSFQIIAKIIDTVIPILVRQRTRDDIVAVLRVFVDVILDVPEHRRMPLYSQLLTQIGPKEHLYIFLLLIVEAQVLAKTKENTQRLDIAKSLCLEFTPDVVILASIQLIEYVKSLPVDKEDYRHGDFIFDVKHNTPKQFRHFKYALVLFASNLLASSEFVAQVAALDDAASEGLEEHYKKLIVSILTYIQSTSRVAESNARTPQAHYWKVMLHHAYDLLDSLNALLTSQMFLLVIKGLMTHQLHTVKRRALELLNSRLQRQPQFFADCDQTDLFAMISPLIIIIKEVEKETLDNDEEVIIQTALLSLKLFVRLLATENPEKFVQILRFITELIKSKINVHILASAILCLAELCTQLRSNSIASLHTFMPTLIKVLKSQRKEDHPTLLLLSAVTALLKILDVLSLFLSPFLGKLLGEVCNLTAKWNDSEDSKVAPFVVKFKSVRDKLGASIPSRVLIPAIDATYRSLISSGHYAAIGPLMEILSGSLSHLPGAEIQHNLIELTSFFLHALEFRTMENSTEDLTPSVVADVETCVINALISFVLKLSESSFRPLYYKLYDWAIRCGEKNEKIITFYSFSQGIANSLKGLFVLFAAHFLSNAATVVDACNAKNGTLYFEEERKNIELLENTLKTLNAVFLYHSHKFINKERFDMLMQPVVDQLDNTLGDYEQRVRELVIPMVVNFTVATADDSLWKQLNYQVLLKMRDARPKIRMLALECLRDVCIKVGEDFLPLLPETIPFLAELLEDEDEGIEKACQRTIQELEKVLGEPLAKYF